MADSKTGFRLNLGRMDLTLQCQTSYFSKIYILYTAVTVAERVRAPVSRCVSEGSSPASATGFYKLSGCKNLRTAVATTKCPARCAQGRKSGVSGVSRIPPKCLRIPPPKIEKSAY